LLGSKACKSDSASKFACEVLRLASGCTTNFFKYDSSIKAFVLNPISLLFLSEKGYSLES
tara:strand:+ start:872 stop:1051 length:180 start_codon:yes stop_codon:yes gene_type:complete